MQTHSVSSIQEDFLTQGYAIGKGIVAKHKINQLREVIHSHLDRFARSYLEPFDSSLPHLSIDQRINEIFKNNQGYAKSLLQAVLTDSQNDQRIGKLIEEETIWHCISDLMPGYKIHSYTARIRASVYGMREYTTTWHSDLADESRSEGNCNKVRLACWIPLSDVDRDTGALQCQPGTYQSSQMIRNKNGQYAFPDGFIQEENRLVLDCQKGDALFLDRFLPHSSIPVQREMTRWSIVTWVKAEVL